MHVHDAVGRVVGEQALEDGEFAVAPHEALRFTLRYAVPEPHISRPYTDARGRYSHSMVPGGFDVMSSTTRLTSRSSPIMRAAICSSRS